MIRFHPKRPISYEYKNKSSRRGAQFVPIGMPTTCWNSVPPKETNMLSMRNSFTVYYKCESCRGEVWMVILLTVGFLQKLVKDKKIHEARAFNFTYRNICILMTFYLSIILDLQNFFHWYILQSYMSIKINRTHWYADELLKQCPSKGDKYVIDEEFLYRILQMWIL
jgi:hypothetical protein